MRVHWLGAGMSSGPGVGYLAGSPHIEKLVLWNRTISHAHDLIHKQGIDHIVINEWDEHTFTQALLPGDLVVSFLTANLHLGIARICLDRGAHLFTSSYVSTELRAIATEATKKGLYFCNELGLDPGLDHLFAHLLVKRFKDTLCISKIDPAKIKIDFISCCGGFPQHPGEFRYQFSWSPLGVLRALKNPARWLERGAIREEARPYEHVVLRSIQGEDFESYPNRDSLPFAEEYGLCQSMKQSSFQRATLRPVGWCEAWRKIFEVIRYGDEEELRKMAKDLEMRHCYTPGNYDRVVMEVRLKAHHQGGLIFDGSFSLDVIGNDQGTAMARTVSGTTAIFVELFASGELQTKISPGVHGFNEIFAEHWENVFGVLTRLGINVRQD